jgi:ribosome-binding ATPase YchF (GTP1/OBG family)
MAKKFMAYVAENYPGIPSVVVSSLLEEEISQIRTEEGEEAAREYMELSNMEETALDRLLEECSNVLGLQKFYTAGPSHVSSWFIKKGNTAPQAAGSIHGGFEKAFICAEISKVEDWINIGDEEAIRAKNKWQRFGKEYVMQENDVVIFKHNLK